MLIDVEDGFAPPEWQSYVGPVLAYRPQIGGQSVQHFNSKSQYLVFLWVQIGMSGYHFFLISGYLDILDTDFFGYLDKWILGFHG